MKSIIIERAFSVWGPGNKCVLCRAFWSLMPSSGKAHDVPDEVADAAVKAGAARVEMAVTGGDE